MTGFDLAILTVIPVAVALVEHHARHQKPWARWARITLCVCLMSGLLLTIGIR